MESGSHLEVVDERFHALLHRCSRRRDDLVVVYLDSSCRHLVDALKVAYQLSTITGDSGPLTWLMMRSDSRNSCTRHKYRSSRGKEVNSCENESGATYSSHHSCPQEHQTPPRHTCRTGKLSYDRRKRQSSPELRRPTSDPKALHSLST